MGKEEIPRYKGHMGSSSPASSVPRCVSCRDTRTGGPRAVHGGNPGANPCMCERHQWAGTPAVPLEWAADRWNGACCAFARDATPVLAGGGVLIDILWRVPRPLGLSNPISRRRHAQGRRTGGDWQRTGPAVPL